MTSDHGLKRSKLPRGVFRAISFAIPLLLLLLLPTPPGDLLARGTTPSTARLPPAPAPPSFPSCPPGDPTLHISNVFSGPSLVLQHAPASSRIWGWVHPSCGVKVVVSSAAGTVLDAPPPTIAYHKDGKWIASLPPIEGSTAVYTLTVASTSGGAVLNTSASFGEVYFCSGQSNMVGLNTWPGMESDSSVAASLTVESEAVKQASLEPLPLHGFRVGMKDAWAEGAPLQELASPPELPWTSLPNSQAASQFSAVCFWMGRKVAKGLGGGIPVGLIESAWGGSWLQAWSDEVSRGACSAPGFGVSWAPGHPGSLFNSMVHPFFPMALGGIAFLQGESNALVGQQEYYKCGLPLLVASWRRGFKGGYSPAGAAAAPPPLYFGVVELAPFARHGWGDGFPGVRVAQSLAVHGGGGEGGGLLLIPTGDARDKTGDIHPRAKKIMGDRLGEGALALLAKQQPPRGPLVIGFTDKGGGVVHLQLAPSAEGVEVREDEGFCDGVDPNACCGYGALVMGSKDGGEGGVWEDGWGISLVGPSTLALTRPPGKGGEVGPVVGVRGQYCMWPKVSVFSKQLRWPAHPFLLSKQA